MKKDLTSIITFILLGCIRMSYAQDDLKKADSLYNAGTNWFNKGNYNRADSLFTRSLNLYPAVDAYYDRALTRDKLGNDAGFCNDLYMATAKGDSIYRRLFLKYCTHTDTIYLDSHHNISQKSLSSEIRIVARHLYDTSKEVIMIDSLGKVAWNSEIDTVPIFSIQRDSNSVELSKILMPVFPGKETGLQYFLSKNLHYPTKSRNNGIQGRVVVTFVISKEGHVEDIKIKRGVNEELNNESMRVVRIMPQWFPGVYKGRFVRIQYTVPVTFAQN